MKVVRSLAVLSLLGVVLAGSQGGCGSDDPGTSTTGGNIFQNGSIGGAGSTGGNGTATNTAAGGAASGSIVPAVPTATPAAPGAITTVGPSLCSTQTINAYGSTPDMMIVLDRSLSMQLYNRWDPSKNAVSTITTEFERLVSFGLVMFPGSGAADPNALVGSILDGLLGGMPMGGVGCAGGEKVDVPLKTMNAQAINAAINAAMPIGLTPTGTGLGVALQALGDRKPGLDAVVKPGYVLLVTDGEPSCDPTVSPDTMQTDAAIMAVKALKAANIPTYVIGYQIDAMFQPIMNQMAMEGGTMMYHPAESADQIVQTFREITKDVVKCSFELSMVPPNPKFVRVTIDKKTVVLDAADGWVISGKTVTLQGGSCATLKDGKGHDLNAQIECNEVTLN
jgi:Mg-chelatase subunit ChlD